MADVKIVDIDSEQWNIKDQEARTRIAALEEKTTVKKTVLYNTNELNVTVLEINEEKFLQAHFDGFSWNGEIGAALVTFSEDIGNTVVLRGVVHVAPTNQVGRIATNIDFGTDKTLYIYPLLTDQSTGTFRPSQIYGDIFLKII